MFAVVLGLDLVNPEHHRLGNHGPTSWRHTARCVVAGAAIVFAYGAAAGGVPDADRQAELLHRLRHDCGSCHGMTMKGGLGPPLLPSTLEGRPDQELAKIILNGVPRTPMPPWQIEITDDEALWLVRRLKEGLDEN